MSDNVKPTSNAGSLVIAFALYLLAYLLAMAVVFFVGRVLDEQHPIIIALCADIAATLVVFLFSRVFRNSSFYDAYWSIAPLAIALYWAFGITSVTGITARQIVVLMLVFAWGLRLTGNWASQWQGLKHEDWRYADLRKRYGRLFWLIDLVGIEMIPTVVVFLGCLALYPSLSAGKNPLGILDVIAIIVTAGAIVIESVADAQLRKFRKTATQPREIMDSELWAYSRHPNYFGEITFWWGLYLFALAANPGYWWTVTGPLAVTILFLTVSIPMMEKRNLERRSRYEEHRNKVPALIPRLFRK